VCRILINVFRFSVASQALLTQYRDVLQTQGAKASGAEILCFPFFPLLCTLSNVLSLSFLCSFPLNVFPCHFKYPESNFQSRIVQASTNLEVLAHKSQRNLLQELCPRQFRIHVTNALFPPTSNMIQNTTTAQRRVCLGHCTHFVRYINTAVVHVIEGYDPGLPEIPCADIKLRSVIRSFLCRYVWH
jgi:hypothetical protein